MDGDNQYPRDLEELAAFECVNQPMLPALTRGFLHDQLRNDDDPTSSEVDPDDLPNITGNVYVFHSAVATFYAPGDEAGIHGMRREHIHSMPVWRKLYERRDCALVVDKEGEPGFRGLSVVRVRLLFSFMHNEVEYPCVLVESSAK